MSSRQIPCRSRSCRARCASVLSWKSWVLQGCSGGEQVHISCLIQWYPLPLLHCSAMRCTVLAESGVT